MNRRDFSKTLFGSLAAFAVTPSLLSKAATSKPDLVVPIGTEMKWILEKRFDMLGVFQTTAFLDILPPHGNERYYVGSLWMEKPTVPQLEEFKEMSISCSIRKICRDYPKLAKINGYTKSNPHTYKLYSS